MNLNTKGTAFAEAYDDGRHHHGMSHAQAYERAALSVVAQWAKQRGHLVLRQGLAFECGRCGRSCSVAIKDGSVDVTGALAREKCS